jgi:addiction module HigA family antidote
MASQRNEYAPDRVSVPGETLAEIIEDRGISQAELAERLGRPKKTVNEIMRGKAAITPETAVQLEHVLGIPAAFWNNLEGNYRGHLAAAKDRDNLRGFFWWMRRFPVAMMHKHGWIDRPADKTECVRELLRFFAVSSPEQWEQVYAVPQASFRKSAAFDVDTPAVAAWLRRGEIAAQAIDCRPFDRTAFVEALHDVRGLTREDNPKKFVPKLTKLCAAAGVAVAFVPETPGSRVSGATKWLSPARALIQLSLRYKSDDHLWFTFFHEAGHIVLHGKRMVFLEANGKRQGRLEEEADRFAADTLIPPVEFEKLHRLCPGPFCETGAIESFARRIGVSPGIAVGRLQHEHILDWNQGNHLKTYFEWAGA